MYENDAQEMVCSCVPTYTGQRAVPLGSVYVTCVVPHVTATARANRQQVKVGQTLALSLLVRTVRSKYSTGSSTLTLRIDLPAGVNYVAANSPGQGPKRPHVNGSELVWSSFALPASGKPRMVLVKVRVMQATPLTPLTFNTTVLQTGTDCAALTKQITVRSIGGGGGVCEVNRW